MIEKLFVHGKVELRQRRAHLLGGLKEIPRLAHRRILHGHQLDLRLGEMRNESENKWIFKDSEEREVTTRDLVADAVEKRVDIVLGAEVIGRISIAGTFHRLDEFTLLIIRSTELLQFGDSNLNELWDFVRELHLDHFGFMAELSA